MATSRSKSPHAVLKVLAPIGIILTLVIGGLYAIQSTLSPHGPANGTVEVRVGSILPDFRITLLNGKTSPVSELKGKVFLINFWATWCEACMEEMPSIVKLRELYKDRGFEVLAINLDDNPEVVVPKTAKQLKMEFPIYTDVEGKMGELFDVHAIPLTVIMNHDRKILLKRDGEQDWNSPAVQSQIEAWLSG